MNLQNELINGCGFAIMPIENMKIFNQLRDNFLNKMGNLNELEKNIDGLSMGMSSDYREAILSGATTIRVGTLLFGKRK